MTWSVSYLFSSANSSPVRSVLRLQDWRCVWKRETSFPVKQNAIDLLAAIFLVLPSCRVYWFRMQTSCSCFANNCQYRQWRTQKIFMRDLVHMVVICIWCALFVTSQFDVISMFPNQRFSEVCWHNNAYISTSTPLILCVIALNTNYQRSKLVCRRKMNSTLRHSSSYLQKYQAGG